MPQSWGEFALGKNVAPRGWARRWLEIQRAGLTGNLEVAGPPFNTRLWAQPAIPHRKGASPWWPYEQTAYWVDGFTRCGLALDDPDLLARARKQFDYVLKHADKDGYLGPKSCKPPMPAGRWSHMIFFRALWAWGQSIGDKRVVPALLRHYLESEHDHSDHRDVCNIEILALLYEATGRKELITMAERIWRDYQANLSENDGALAKQEIHARRPGFGHGVTFCETAKVAAILYRVTGRKAYLSYAKAAYNKLNTYHMLVSGAPSSTEALRGITALDAHETCDIADFSWGAGHLLMATGDPRWADDIERAAFNAHPGAVTKDFKALQYFSAPNQVVLSRTSCHVLAATGGKWMCYSPRPGTECCSSNLTRIFPNYIARMWMQKDGNPAATLYGPSTLTFEKKGQRVDLVQETAYPFSDTVDISVRTERPVAFTLWLRMPGWTKKPVVTVNDAAIRPAPKPGTWYAVKRVFRQNDRIRLRFPMALRLTDWPEGGVALERGPLVYALPVPATWKINRDDPHQTKEFPAWELFPAGPWNYALDIDRDQLEEQVRVVHGPASLDPWKDPPLFLDVPARRVRGWQLRHAKVLPTYGANLVDPARNIWSEYKTVVRGSFPITPPLPDPATLSKRLGKQVEQIRLVPYGHTLLRLTIFPWARRPST